MLLSDIGEVSTTVPQQYHMLHLWLRNDVRDTSRPQTKARILTTKMGKSWKIIPSCANKNLVFVAF